MGWKRGMLGGCECEEEEEKERRLNYWTIDRTTLPDDLPETFTRKCYRRKHLRSKCLQARPAGFEPATNGLEIRCSIP